MLLLLLLILLLLLFALLLWFSFFDYNSQQYHYCYYYSYDITNALLSLSLLLLLVLVVVVIIFLVQHGATANLRTKILDFRGFDSSIILMLRGGRGGVPLPIGSLPQSLSQRILAGIILGGRLGAHHP